MRHELEQCLDVKFSGRFAELLLLQDTLPCFAVPQGMTEALHFPRVAVRITCFSSKLGGRADFDVPAQLWRDGQIEETREIIGFEVPLNSTKKVSGLEVTHRSY